MNRIELFAKLREIAKQLDLHKENNVPDKESLAKTDAALNAIKEELQGDAGKMRMLAYYYAMLIDADAVTSNPATIQYLQKYASALLNATPGLEIYIGEIRKVSESFLKYLMFVTYQSLSAMVRDAKLANIEPEWLDPATNQVMNIPVTYYVDNKAYTYDLFTLLHNSNSSFGLRTPDGKYIYLDQLSPNLDIVKSVLTRTKQSASARIIPDINAELKKALDFVLENDLTGLEKWHADNEGINLDLDVNGLGSLLHNACALYLFDIAIFLIKKRAYALHQNKQGKTAAEYLNLQILNNEISDDSNNVGFMFLKALTYFSPSAQHQGQFLKALVPVVAKQFVPALIINGGALCISTEPKDVIRGINQLRFSMKKNSVDAALLLCEIYNNILVKESAYITVEDVENKNAPIFDDEAEHITTPLIRPKIRPSESFNKKILVSDIMALLSSKAYIPSRSMLEENVARMLHELLKQDRSNRGYNKLKALCYANSANSVTQSSENNQLLKEILISLGHGSVGHNILALMQKDTIWQYFMSKQDPEDFMDDRLGLLNLSETTGQTYYAMKLKNG